MGSATVVLTLLVLLLAWVNGANDVSKAVSTLIGSGISGAATAIHWGTVWTVLGGVGALLWGSALASNFSLGYLQSGFDAGGAFTGAALAGALGWLVVATRFGLPVSTTHALLGGIVGAALALAGPESLRGEAIAGKAVLPLLVSPAIAIAICWLFLMASRWLSTRLPPWVPGCCPEADWRADPYRCAPAHELSSRRSRLLTVLHWTFAGATSFARGANDVAKIAGFLALSTASVMQAEPDTTWLLAVGAVTLAMGFGSWWGGYRVARVLAHRVSRLDPAQGITANAGTAFLVLCASPMGLPVSTTHVSAGALMGIRLANRVAPQSDALRSILFAWLITVPFAACLAALIGALSQ